MQKKWLNFVHKKALVAAVFGLAAVISVAAHHGWSEYDADRTLDMTGTIREYGYSNPHGVVRLQVDGEQGKTWLVVLAPPARMQRRGLTREMLRPGTTATVVGYPHRRNADEMRAERIRIGDRTVELR